MTAELAKVINDGLCYYEQDLQEQDIQVSLLQWKFYHITAFWGVITFDLHLLFPGHMSETPWDFSHMAHTSLRIVDVHFCGLGPLT